MSTIRGNPKRKRGDSIKEPEYPEEKFVPDDSQTSTKNSASKPGPTTNVAGQSREAPEDEHSPKGKKKIETSARRKVKLVADEVKIEDEPATGKRQKKSKGERSRTSSTTTDTGDMLTSRSSRNRQPSRRMVESKISEELVKEQLAPRKRLSSHKEAEVTEQAEEGEETVVHIEQIESEIIKEEPPPKLRKLGGKIKPRVGKPEDESMPTQTNSELPKVIFKTVTQQPELPKEALMVGGKKPFVTSTTATSITKPILTMRAGPSKIPPKIVTQKVEKAQNAGMPKISLMEKSRANFAKAEPNKMKPTETLEEPPPMEGPDYSNVVNEEVVEEHHLSRREIRRVEEDDDGPPQLQAIEKTAHEASQAYIETEHGRFSPGGTTQYVTVSSREDGTEIFVDENGDEVQMVDELGHNELGQLEFNFLDSKNICCGLCGEIVPYDTLMSVHLPQHHPEVVTETVTGSNIEEVPYERWLSDKLYMEKKNIEGGFRYEHALGADDYVTMRMRGHRPLRKVSQIRVNPIEMDMTQLNHALNKKMIEKMGRKVPVTLVDKQHAKCGICNAVVSLNKKFEIVHLVRHFNAWHPSAHRCAGQWGRELHPKQPPIVPKPLSIQDFAVIDVNMDATDNLQCIWCGMFMDRNALAMHFTEVHPDEIEVPKCLLCLQELVINARFLEKYGEDFEVILPDEHHVKSHKFAQTYSSESALDKAIAKRMQKLNASAANGSASMEAAAAADDDDDEDDREKTGTVTNSRMTFGRRNKPKRSFVQPSLRQAVPVNSKYVEPITECHWKCKLCKGNIFGAVISAGAIKHYKQYHPGEMENMQYELCKARLDRVSGGCMEFVHPQLVECLICNLTYALHKPYNMCRGIRHLKLKHPDQMPENSGANKKDDGPVPPPPSASSAVPIKRAPTARLGEIIEDAELLARFRGEYSVEFDKVQAVYDEDNEPVYVLLGPGEQLDVPTASQVLQSVGDKEQGGAERVVYGPSISQATNFDEEDPYGNLAEDEELAAIEGKGQTSRRVMKRAPEVTAEIGTYVEEKPGEIMGQVLEEGVEYEAVEGAEAYEEYEYAEEYIEGEEGQYLEGYEEYADE